MKYGIVKPGVGIFGAGDTLKEAVENAVKHIGQCIDVETIQQFNPLSGQTLPYSWIDITDGVFNCFFLRGPGLLSFKEMTYDAGRNCLRLFTETQD